jgi:cytochrome b561
VVLHILAALKHLMFHEDETVARIFVPRTDNTRDEE